MERLYVLGHPVAHSKSPVMHNAAYRALGLDWKYDLADCPSEAEAKSFLEAGDWLAVNITMPYKPLAYSMATDRSTASEMARGANVLVRREGRLHADNTDGKGCVSYLRRCGVAFEGARVVVCGTGPTSLAIMHACQAAGAGRVTLLSRDGARARQALEAYRASAPASDAVLLAGSYGECSDEIADAALVVDATSLGMKPGDPAPFDTELLSPGQTVFDVVYGHGETSLLRAATHKGCKAYDGLGMLVAQAVETVFDIAAITGLVDIPSDLDLFAVMAQAVR